MIAFLCDPKHRHWLSARGDDPDALLGDYIAAINAAITGRPDGLTIGLHLCRGNMSGHWLAEGGYEPVADALFNTTSVDAFFLEYDTPRAGDFKPLRFVPEGKTIVLGLVCTKTPDLEEAEMLKGRIDEAAQFVGLEQLCLSPQCGFASNYIGNPVTIEDERKKLTRIVEVANDVWENA